MQEVFKQRKYNEANMEISIFDAKMSSFKKTEYEIYSIAIDDENCLFFIKDNNINELKRKITLLNKIALLKNLDPQDSRIYHINKNMIEEKEFINNLFYFGNIIYNPCDLVTVEKMDVNSLSKEERVEIVDFLKEQNKIILEHFVESSSLYSLLFSLHIDLIVKVSEHNEIDYFNEIFKSKDTNFEDVITLLMITRNKIEVNEEIKIKFLNQYIDFFGSEKIKNIYHEYNEKKNDFNLKKINGLLMSNMASSDNLVKVFKILNDKTNALFDNSESVTKYSMNEREIILDLEQFFIEIKQSHNQEFIDYIHKEIEDLHNGELFLSLNKNKIFVKTGNVEKIANNYSDLLESIMEVAKKNDLSYNFLTGEEIKKMMRKSYLLSIMDKNENYIKAKKKI